jgi:hypothetical protein
MNKALDEVRAGESRRIAGEGGVPVLKKSRWLLLKREENLKTEQRLRLRVLRYNLKTVRAYLLKEAFQQLWDYNSPTWAEKFLDDWCRQVMRSRIEPMKNIARSLRQHRELILNYFRTQKLLSSGVVEGLNNKAKVTMRKSYGFRTFRCLELALYHSLGKLPEPESTHEFFWRTKSFNGAAINWFAELNPGNGGGTTITRLQWGRDQLIAEFKGSLSSPQDWYRFNGAAINWSRNCHHDARGAVRLLASMGPRSTDRGIHPFTEAERYLAELQWGRDQLIAELHRRRRLRPDLERFNGAAINWSRNYC